MAPTEHSAGRKSTLVPAPSDQARSTYELVGRQMMAIHHSEETHQLLVARVPRATGRDLPEWFRHLEAGPAFGRFEDRVNWLRDEYGLAHGHATAIVHEHALQRSRRAFA